METNAMPLPPELRLECAVCGRAFPSGLVRDRRPSEGVDPPVRVHECPFCGFTTAYGAADYR